MFRQVCLLAVAFLAVADAVNNEPKSIKDSKSVGSSNKKTKATTFCADVRTSFDVDKMSAMKGGRMSTLSQGFLFDCDKKLDEDTESIGVLSLSCSGLMRGFENIQVPTETEVGIQCDGIITVNTEDHKHAKKDFSSISLSSLAPLTFDVKNNCLDNEATIDFKDECFSNVDVGQATGLVINGANGAWGKPDNIKDITFKAVDRIPGGIFDGTFEVEIEYKFRGFDVVA